LGPAAPGSNPRDRVTFAALTALQQVGVNQMTVSRRRGTIVDDRQAAREKAAIGPEA
jgi:hypothetical protein